MNRISPPDPTLKLQRDGNGSRRRAWLLNIVLGRVATLILAAFALVLGVGSFAYLAGGIRLGLRSGAAFGLAIGDITILLLLIGVLAARVARVVSEARRGAGILARPETR